MRKVLPPLILLLAVFTVLMTARPSGRSLTDVPSLRAGGSWEAVLPSAAQTEAQQVDFTLQNVGENPLTVERAKALEGYLRGEWREVTVRGGSLVLTGGYEAEQEALIAAPGASLPCRVSFPFPVTDLTPAEYRLVLTCRTEDGTPHDVEVPFLVSDAQALRRVERTLGLSLTGGTLLRQGDDHGGMGGDGTAWAVLTFTGGAAERMAAFPGGAALPLPEPLRTAVYGGEDWDSLVKVQGAPLIPGGGSGWYWFRDRQSKSADPSDLLSRSSFNFTLALYDAEQGTLYYYELDT